VPLDAYRGPVLSEDQAPRVGKRLSKQKAELLQAAIPCLRLRDLCTANVLILVILRRFSVGKFAVVRESNRDRIDRRPERRSRGTV